MNEENKVVETEETVEEIEVKESKIKKAGKVILKIAKKAALPVATAVAGFALGRLTKGAIDELPEEVKETVEAVTESVTE